MERFVQYSLPVLCEGGAFGTLVVRTGGEMYCSMESLLFVLE